MLAGCRTAAAFGAVRANDARKRSRPHVGSVWPDQAHSRPSWRRWRRRALRTWAQAASTSANPGRPGGGPCRQLAMTAQHTATSSASAPANSAAGNPARAQPATTQPSRPARPANTVNRAPSSPAGTRNSAPTGRPGRRHRRPGTPWRHDPPPGCHLELDREATEVVLSNLRIQLRLSWKSLIASVQECGDTSLAEWLAESATDRHDLYRRSQGGWTALRREAGFAVLPSGPDEVALGRAIGRMLHIDDPERCETYRAWLSAPSPPEPAALGERDIRLLHMLDFDLWGSAVPAGELPVRGQAVGSRGDSG